MADQNNKISLEEALSQGAGNAPTATPAPATAPTPAAKVEQPKVDAATAVDKAADQLVQAKLAEPTPATVTPEVKPADVKPVETKPAETKPAETKPEEKKDGKVNPMKEIRDKYAAEKAGKEKIEALVQRYTSGSYEFKLKEFMKEGKMDYEALDAAMNTSDTKVKAEAKGITPEVQAEIDRIERDKIEIQKQRLQITMDRALTNLQQNMNIKGSEVNNFFKDAMSVKKNPYQWLAQGGDLQDLYILVYRDKLLKQQIDNAVGQAKTKWEEERARQSKIPVANPAQSSQPKPINNNGVSLSDLLTQAAERKK
jgi:hypothetical protein